MSAQMQSTPETLPAFCEGIQYFADSFPEIDRLGAAPLARPRPARAARRDQRGFDLPDPARRRRAALPDPAGHRQQVVRPSGRLRLQRRRGRRAAPAGPPQHGDRGRPPRARLLFGDVPRHLAGGHGHPHRGRDAHALPRAPRPAGPPVGRDPRPAGPRRSARPGTAFRDGRRLPAPRQALPRHHRRRRAGRALHHERVPALRHRLPRRHQLPAGAGVERLFAGAPQHGVAVGQRAHDRLLARPRLRRGAPDRRPRLRRLVRRAGVYGFDHLRLRRAHGLHRRHPESGRRRREERIERPPRLPHRQAAEGRGRARHRRQVAQPLRPPHPRLRRREIRPAAPRAADRRRGNSPARTSAMPAAAPLRASR